MMKPKTKRAAAPNAGKSTGGQGRGEQGVGRALWEIGTPVPGMPGYWRLKEGGAIYGPAFEPGSKEAAQEQAAFVEVVNARTGQIERHRRPKRGNLVDGWKVSPAVRRDIEQAAGKKQAGFGDWRDVE